MKFITKDDFIDVLELSTRTNNCLRRAEVHTIGSLIEYAKNNHFKFINAYESPITGQKSKNIEYISLFERE